MHVEAKFSRDGQDYLYMSKGPHSGSTGGNAPRTYAATLPTGMGATVVFGPSRYEDTPDVTGPVTVQDASGAVVRSLPDYRGERYEVGFTAPTDPGTYYVHIGETKIDPATFVVSDDVRIAGGGVVPMSRSGEEIPVEITTSSPVNFGVRATFEIWATVRPSGQEYHRRTFERSVTGATVIGQRNENEFTTSVPYPMATDVDSVEVCAEITDVTR